MNEAKTKPSEILKSINLIQQDICKLGGISKDKKNPQQGYKFRGIDDIYNVVSPLMAEHGVVCSPVISDRQVVERQTRNSGVLYDVTVTAQFHFFSLADGSRFTVQTIGEAFDSGDKATNKAMSAAHKYALLMTFAIPTECEDADAQTPSVTVAKAPISQPAAAPVQVGAIEESQLAEIASLVAECEKYGWSRDLYAEWMVNSFGLTSARLLTKSQTTHAIEHLKNRVSQLKLSAHGGEKSVPF